MCPVGLLLSYIVGTVDDRPSSFLGVPPPLFPYQVVVKITPTNMDRKEIQ